MRETITLFGITLLIGIGMIFPVMADSSTLRLVSDLSAPTGEVFVSVDFDQNGICDEEAVLISISTVQKVGISQYCMLPNI